MLKRTVRNEDGFILVWSLMVMVVLLLLGVASITSSVFEEQMAANDALYKKTFYQADGGTEVALAVLKHNICCIAGFSSDSLEGAIEIVSGKENFWVTNNDPNSLGSWQESDRDFYYPSTYSDGGTVNDTSDDDPHTSVRINGRTEVSTGTALQQMAGYEGKGKSLGSEGAFLLYEISIHRFDERNSQIGICTLYRVDNQFASFPSGNCWY